MTPEQSAEDEQVPIETGVTVYNDSGEELGVIVELTGRGFEVSTDQDEWDSEVADAEETEQEHEPGHEFGEGYIMWRCDDCGEMGKLDDGFPDRCPDCGSEAVYKWKED
ncbi:hypothetical protein ACFPYI_12810 [Halomarina salina]|uniref:DUF7130 domain-containing protein n=1 Tax=Halomarina salina TaxID=1872699 RepID=A0ABD5RPN9_9EURY|nr:hypothetical protein [Halomarina salina]